MHFADQVVAVIVGTMFVGGIAGSAILFRQWQKAKQRLQRRSREY